MGAGIGGPARALARHYEAQVTAVEPTERFASLARTLTERAGLSDRVTVVQTDGSVLPFTDARALTSSSGHRRSGKASRTSVRWRSRSVESSRPPDGSRCSRRSATGANCTSRYRGATVQPTAWSRQKLTSGPPWRTAGCEKWLTREEAQGALASSAADTELMTTGLPGVGLSNDNAPATPTRRRSPTDCKNSERSPTARPRTPSQTCSGSTPRRTSTACSPSRGAGPRDDTARGSDPPSPQPSTDLANTTVDRMMSEDCASKCFRLA